MNINLDSLPLEIYKKIPIGIKTYKKDYEISELPYEIQKLILESNQEKIIDYDNVYDFDPIISEFGDFTSIKNLRELVLKYAMAYLYTLRGSYPFNGSVGSDVKKFLQKRDTTIQKLYLTEELNNMVSSFATSVDIKVKVKEFRVVRSESAETSEYSLIISLNIADESTQFRAKFIL